VTIITSYMVLVDVIYVSISQKLGMYNHRDMIHPATGVAILLLYSFVKTHSATRGGPGRLSGAQDFSVVRL
jgi:hypothetical protein